MSGVHAWETLNDPEKAAKLTMEGFERLLLRAGYPADEAHKAAMDRGWNRLSAGETL